MVTRQLLPDVSRLVQVTVSLRSVFNADFRGPKFDDSFIESTVHEFDASVSQPGDLSAW